MLTDAFNVHYAARTVITVGLKDPLNLVMRTFVNELLGNVGRSINALRGHGILLYRWLYYLSMVKAADAATAAKVCIFQKIGPLLVNPQFIDRSAYMSVRFHHRSYVWLL